MPVGHTLSCFLCLLMLVWLGCHGLEPEAPPPDEGPPRQSDICAGNPPVWEALPQVLRGAVFHGAQYTPLQHCVTTQGIHSFCDVATIVNADFNPDHAYAISVLSPAVLRLATGRVVGVFRAMPRARGKRNVRNMIPRFLVQATLNESYHLASPLTPIGIPAPQHSMYSGPVDPRLFEHQGGLYMLFEMQRPYGGWTSHAYPMTEGGTYLWGMNRSRLVSLRLFQGPKLLSQAKRDKNWVPLVWNGDLLVIRNHDPLELLNCSLNGHCDVIQFSKAARPPPRIVRGGTPLLPYRGPYYVGLVHSNYEKCRGGWRWYTYQVVLVRAHPAFAITYISEPLDVRLPLAPPVPTPRFVDHFCFPLGVVLRDRDTLDYGVHCDDRVSFMVRLTGLRPLLREAMALDASRGPLPPVPGAIQAYYGALYRSRCNASQALPFVSDRCDPSQNVPPQAGPTPVDVNMGDAGSKSHPPRPMRSALHPSAPSPSLM